MRWISIIFFSFWGIYYIVFFITLIYVSIKEEWCFKNPFKNCNKHLKNCNKHLNKCFYNQYKKLYNYRFSNNSTIYVSDNINTTDIINTKNHIITII